MFQAEFDDEELGDFFQAVLDRCICTKCRRNSISVFIQPYCDHRICSECSQSFDRTKTYFCPSRTCDNRFPANHLTPDLAFRFLWEYCSENLDEGVFSQLTEGFKPETSDEPETRESYDNAGSDSSVDFLGFPEQPGSVSQVNLQVSNAPDSATKPYSTASKDSHGAPKEEAQCKTPNKKTGLVSKRRSSSKRSKEKHEDSVPSTSATAPTKKKRNTVTTPSKDGDCAETRSVSPSSNVRQDPSNEKIIRAYAKVEAPASPDANQSSSAEDEPTKDELHTCDAISGNGGNLDLPNPRATSSTPKTTPTKSHKISSVSVIAASPNVTQNTSAKDKPTREELPSCAATSANSRNLGLPNPQTTPSTPKTKPSKKKVQVRSQNTSSGSDITPLPKVTQNTPAKDKPTRKELPNFAATSAIGGNLGQPNPLTTLSTPKMTTLSTLKITTLSTPKMTSLSTPAKTQNTSSGSEMCTSPYAIQGTSAQDKPMEAAMERLNICAATSADGRNLVLPNPRTTLSTPKTTPTKSHEISSGPDITPLPNVTQDTPAKDKPTRKESPNFAATSAIGGNLGQPNPLTTLSTPKITTLSTPKMTSLSTPAKTQKTSSGSIICVSPYANQRTSAQDKPTREGSLNSDATSANGGNVCLTLCLPNPRTTPSTSKATPIKTHEISSGNMGLSNSPTTKSNPKTTLAITRKTSSGHPGPSTPETTPAFTPESSAKKLKAKSYLKRNKKGETVLHEYCSMGFRQKAEFSLQKLVEMLADGANPNTTDGSNTPLHEAIIFDRVDIMMVLLEGGALVNCYGVPPSTPLHVAVTRSVQYAYTDLPVGSIPYKIITALLDFGADKSLKDCRRRTPCDIAANNPAILKLLNDYQPKIRKRVELLAPEPPMVVLPCTNHDKKLLKDLKAFAARFKVNCLQEKGGFKPEVTHLVVPNGTKNANFIMRMAILNGCFVVTMKWITDSHEHGRLLPAEAYEIPYPLVPNSREGYVSRRARMDKLHMLPKLFAGGQFHVLKSPALSDQLKRDIVKLIENGGGGILSREPKDGDLDDNQPMIFHAPDGSPWEACSVFILYALEPRDLMYRMPHMKHVPISWLMDCIDTYAIRDE